MDDDLKNNISTIAVLVFGVLSPYLAQYLTADQFSALAIALVDIALVLYSARHPNTMEIFGNSKCDCGVEEEIVLNEEYETDPSLGDD